jgi:hypothetical protein
MAASPSDAGKLVVSCRRRSPARLFGSAGLFTGLPSFHRVSEIDGHGEDGDRSDEAHRVLLLGRVGFAG